MPDTDAERGSATIVAMLVGGLAMMSVLGLVGRNMVVEKRAVEDSLAQARAYWAGMAQINYLLSRTRQSGSCSSACSSPGNSDKAHQQYANNYLAEVTNFNSWYYLDTSRSYNIALGNSLCKDPSAPSPSSFPGAGGGYLLIRIAFAPAPGGVPCGGPGAAAAPAAGLPDSLRSLTNTRPLEVRYCVRIPAANATCGNGQAISGSTEVGFQRIYSVRRPIL